jgi:predicted RNase H-like HicB family nuclease
MKMPPLTAVIEREGKWFVASCPELDVTTQGTTIEEAETMLHQAVLLFLGETDEAEVQRRLNRGVKVKKLVLENADPLGALTRKGLPEFSSGLQKETAQIRADVR